MELITENFTIAFFNEQSHRLDSMGHVSSYALQHFAEADGVYSNCHGIKVSGRDRAYSAAVFASGGGTGIHEKCAVIRHHHLVICCGDHVFCLELPSLRLIWKVNADWAACFQVYAIPNGYLIHGELRISRLDLSGNVSWQRGGSDIFDSMDDGESFAVKPNLIEVADFNGRKYRWDWDGNLSV